MSKTTNYTADITIHPTARGLAQPLTPASTVWAAGQTLDLGFAHQMQLQQVIAQAGMGVVWQARWVNTGEAVALKTIRPDIVNKPPPVGNVSWASVIEQEFDRLLQLRSPHIVRSFHLGAVPASNIPVLVLERCEKSLFATAPQLPMSPHAALEVLRQVASGLAALHRAGLRHLDVKPGNILLTPAGALPARYKLADLGACQPQAIVQHRFAGSPGWLAPEQVQAIDNASNSSGNHATHAPHGANEPLYATSPATDVYALGLLLYWLVTGQSTDFAQRTQRLLTAGGEAALRPQHPNLGGALVAADLAQFKKHCTTSLDALELLQAFCAPSQSARPANAIVACQQIEAVLISAHRTNRPHF